VAPLSESPSDARPPGDWLAASDPGLAFRPAAPAELDVLWPAVRAARLLEDRVALAQMCEREPWFVRISDAGEAVLLERWREHLDILHIRMAWCSPKRIRPMLADVRRVAEEHGMSRLLSPALDARSIQPYVAAGLTAQIRLVAYTWAPGSIAHGSAPRTVRLREATELDTDALTALEAACFPEFWLYGRDELFGQLDRSRVVVAEEEGEVIGYTLTTLSRGLATLARVAVCPDMRGRGVGRALVSEASAYAAQASAASMSLCTQEANDASRALYASLGLEELPDRVLLAADASVRF
jgi:[ribosomal protein S18]-alanine N-acetyltransferase